MIRRSRNPPAFMKCFFLSFIKNTRLIEVGCHKKKKINKKIYIFIIQVKIHPSTVCNYFITKNLLSNESHFYGRVFLKVHPIRIQKLKKRVMML